MPFESEAQRKAMYASASGKGNIGIPKEVAKKFIKHSTDEIPKEPTVLSTPEFIEDESSDLTEARHQLDSIQYEIKAIAQKILAYKGDGLMQKVQELHSKDKEIVARLGQSTEAVPRHEDDSEAWETKEGKNKNGGLNAKGRASYNKEHGAHLKAPQPEGGSRKASFCARMKGMKEKLTSSATAHDPDSRINKSLRKWKCDSDSIKEDIGKICDSILDYAQSIPDEDPCWQGFTQYGMKEKNGKQVPNCVPDDGKKQINGNVAIYDRPDALVPEKPQVVMPIEKDAGKFGRSSGILFLTSDNQTLMIRRGDGGDYPYTWCVPGGHQNPEDKDLEECARRECFEETGIDYKGKLEVLHDDGQFCTYIARNVKKEDVTLNYESSGYDWADIHCPPLPLHPGLEIALKVASAKTEMDIAELIKCDILSSPQMYANIGLFAIRITGTGLAYRSSINEYVWRDSSLYLNDEFLKRCNGLMVIMDHPESAVLTPKEFKDRVVGSIMLPYIKGDEIWGIAKIYDQDAIDEICEGEISTSPSVVFDNTAGNTTLTTENGDPLLIEGVPFLLDHIAIVTKARGSKGVWDKGGEATGVLLTNPEVSDMTENRNDPKADANGDKLDAILSALSNLAVRVDAMEKDLPAPPLVTAADKKAKRKDDDDDAMCDDDDEESESEAKEMMERKADKKRKDDDDDSKHRKDAKKRKDAEGSDPKEHGKAGEMKPDDEGEVEHPGHIKFKKDDDEEEETKMDDDDEMAMKKDEEEAKMADAQAKADSVFSAFGKSATRPLQGENLTSYRKRLLRGLQAYSDSYKDVNLVKEIKGEKMLSIAEKQIFNDALVAAKSPTMYANDSEYEIHERDRSGRTITKFKGGFGWLDAFKVPSLRAKEFNLNPNNKR